MTDRVTIIFLMIIPAMWCTLLWLALRQPERGNPRKNQNDEARNP